MVCNVCVLVYSENLMVCQLGTMLYGLVTSDLCTKASAVVGEKNAVQAVQACVAKSARQISVLGWLGESYAVSLRLKFY